MRVKRYLRNWLEIIPEVRSWLLERWVKMPQPINAKAHIVLTVLTKAGPWANGKVSMHQHLLPFCETLRGRNFATSFVSSERELSRMLRTRRPTILIHLYGEDNENIVSFELLELERMALATFNCAAIGPILADKLASHKTFEAAGVPVPALSDAGGFVRHRLGTGLQTVQEGYGDDMKPVSDLHIRTQFVDTRIKFNNDEYFVSIRLLCIDNVILHALPRARNARDGDANVHARDTPINSALIEFIHDKLVEPHMEDFSSIADKLFKALGHGFYAHDLLIEKSSGAIFVCESGFKFDSPSYSNRFAAIASEIPSQAIMFSAQDFARFSAEIFEARCNLIVSETCQCGAS